MSSIPSSSLPFRALSALLLSVALLLVTPIAGAQAPAPDAAAEESADLPHVHVLATGGTIAGAGYQGVEDRSSDDLVEAVPELAGLARISTSDPFTLPSSQLTPENLWQIHTEVEKLLEDPDLAGVVVTQGTDSLEETAFLLDLLHDDPRPVVVTGAMRLPTEPGSDGARNLANAVQLAASPAGRDLGVVVVMNELIHAGRAVRKTTARNLDAFQSATTGPLGYFDAPDLFLLRRPLDRLPLDPPGLEPKVDAVTLAVGSDGHLIQAAVDSGAQGLVIDAFGRGNIPRSVVGAMMAARDAGMVIVMTTRTGDGRSRVWPRLAQEGKVIAAGGLDILEARLLLMAALPLTRDQAVLQSWFDVLSGQVGAEALDPVPVPAAPAAASTP